jgi:hypothetical protein
MKNLYLIHVADFPATRKQWQKTVHWLGKLAAMFSDVLCDGPSQMFETVARGEQGEFQGTVHL